MSEKKATGPAAEYIACPSGNDFALRFTRLPTAEDYECAARFCKFKADWFKENAAISRLDKS